MGNVDCRNFYSKEQNKNEIKYNFSLDTHHNYNININNINSSIIDTKIKKYKSNSATAIIRNKNNNKNNNSTSSQEIILSSKEIKTLLSPKSESEKSKKINDNNLEEIKLEKENIIQISIGNNKKRKRK